MNHTSLVEPLEARIAPASLVNASTLTFTDVDGDLVTVKISKGTFTLSDYDGGGMGDDFTFANTGITQQQLQLIDLSGDAEFAKGNLTITAKRGPLGGDGSVNVGYINASGVDLGMVKISGDLGRIDAGDADTKTKGLGALTLQSLGAIAGTQMAGLNVPVAHIAGALGAVTITGDINATTIEVTGGADGKLGPVKIGGSLRGGIVGGSLIATGDIASIAIGGDVRGGGIDLGPTELGTGLISSVGGKIGNVTIGGSLIGADFEKSGSIIAPKGIGALKVGGDVRGGSGDQSGFIDAGNFPNGFAGVSIGGSVIGSVGNYSGLITGAVKGAFTIAGDLVGGTAFQTGYISAEKVGAFTLAGSLIGGEADTQSGYILLGQTASVKIGGDIQGGAGTYSGVVFVHKTGAFSVGGSVRGTDSPGGFLDAFVSVEYATSVKIGGDVVGGAGDQSGFIISRKLGSLTIGGSLLGGAGFRAGSIGVGNVGTLTVLGSIVGFSSTLPAVITASTSDGDLGFGKINVGGRVENARILAGYEAFGSTYDGGGALNADAQIGSLTVGGNWIASSLAAGIEDGNDGFGNANDAKISPSALLDDTAIFSRIASITIRGQVLGTPGSMSDSFGFAAEHIGSVKVGGTTVIPLTAGEKNDTAGQSLATSGDVRVREV